MHSAVPRGNQPPNEKLKPISSTSAATGDPVSTGPVSTGPVSSGPVSSGPVPTAAVPSSSAASASIPVPTSSAPSSSSGATINTATNNNNSSKSESSPATDIVRQQQPPPTSHLQLNELMTYRSMLPLDLFNLNNVNLDRYTENFNTSFYEDYLIKWPELCLLAETVTGCIVGYIIGKAEGVGEDFHGHVTALSVCPEYRKIGLAKQLMTYLEEVSECLNCYFVDLFVKASNSVAVAFYESLGYSVYRVVENYYADNVDALDMRKCCSRDAELKKSLIYDPSADSKSKVNE